MAKSLKEVFLNEASIEVEGMTINTRRLESLHRKFDDLADLWRGQSDVMGNTLYALIGAEPANKKELRRAHRNYEKAVEKSHSIINKMESLLFKIKQAAGLPD